MVEFRYKHDVIRNTTFEHHLSCVFRPKGHRVRGNMHFIALSCLASSALFLSAANQVPNSCRDAAYQTLIKFELFTAEDSNFNVKISVCIGFKKPKFSL